MGLSYGLLDGKSLFVLYFIKLYRILSLWIVVYVLDKVYQASFVEIVYVGHKDPPRLLNLPFVMIAAEGVAFLLAFTLLLIFERRFKSTQNTFIIDETLLWQVMVDYTLTTLTIFLISLVVILAITNCNVLRFKHDGLRGIRAASRLIFYVSAVVILLPCFLVY